MDKDTKYQNRLIKALICYERIGDLAVNINEEVNSLRQTGREFSPNALAELRLAFDAIYEILDNTNRAYRASDSALASLVEPLEEVIDDLVEELNARHVYRMVNHICNAINGIHYQAILTNIEHISDKCSDLAVYILEGEKPEIFGQEHSYLHDLHHSNNENYLAAYESDREKYFSKLADIPVTDVLTGPDDVDEDNGSDNGAASQDNKKTGSGHKLKADSRKHIKVEFRKKN
jgi:phosphate:Na+ symporter